MEQSMAETALSAERLTPPPYHQRLVSLLKAREPELWQWASSARAEEDHAQQVRGHLLKHTYRLDAQGHGDVIGSAAGVAERLGIAAPVTVYQSLGETGMNAALFYLPGEVHIVFSGVLLDTLSSSELDAVLGHEMAHYRLWEAESRDFLTADRLLVMAADDARAASSHAHTARRLRLYTEIYADRGALVGCGDLESAVAALVKTATGLKEVSAASYLRQADEILAGQETVVGQFGSADVDHPETFIRARALRLWAEKDAQLEQWLGRVIEGGLVLDELDLLGQDKLADLSRLLIGELLSPAWFQTPATLAHACAYFPDFKPVVPASGAFDDALHFIDTDTRDYLCYLLLDFAVLDKDLEDAPLAAAFVLSHRLELGATFEQIATRELRLTKRQLTKLKKNAAETLARAAAES
jgi:Zn-dependent protease with chaperone function